ncbi:MAG TPA: 16S rRNA (guanine(527)-N(7))-methyltransferase RsmG [Saprospiraceae bacterium]|nr:16S rRNA (guanine(527)-N(7))-methyltransferase RsmG [Saprospiraceae bacterium]
MQELISSYFSHLPSSQQQKLLELQSLYQYWNEKINVISRKDIESMMLHHVIHSLSIHHAVQWPSNLEILDLGTGGGFPLIPLAITYPEIQFTGLDSIGKKIKVVQEIAVALQLKNIKVVHTRVEEHKQEYDVVVSRAVARLYQLHLWSKPLFKKQKQFSGQGLYCYKGGDLQEELSELRKPGIQHWRIYDFIKEDYFYDKKIIYVPY